MTPRIYSRTAATILLIAGSLHLLRVIMGWDLTLGPWRIPLWLSVILVIIATYMVITGYRIEKNMTG